MEHEVTVKVQAPVEKVWEVLADVERWPEWTASMTKLEVLGDSPLGVGARVRIKQPGLPAAVMTVDEWQPGDRFRWSTSNPGVRTVADHELAAQGDGTTAVTLRLRQTGPAAGLLGLMIGRKARRYVQMEADGLKAASEA